MKRWLARCLAGTLGCGGLALLALLLAGLLAAGGDRSAAHAFRIAAALAGAVAGFGLVTLVVLLSVQSIRSAQTEIPVTEPSRS